MDRKLTQRGEERRRQLMAYATQRFAQNGFHPTSVAEITEGLGVGKGVTTHRLGTEPEGDTPSDDLLDAGQASKPLVAERDHM